MSSAQITAGRAAAPLSAHAMRLGVVAIAGLAVLAGALLVPTIPYGRAIWDYLFVLDGAYRIGLGQTPHVDFASPIGSLTLYLTHWAEIAFPNGNPFVGLHALAWLAAMPILAALAPRFPTGLSFAAALGLLALMMLLPMTLDSTHLSEISYFASYNRFATGLLFLVGLWYVLPKSRHDWLLLAYVLLLLFFLKITAAAVALGIMLAAAVLYRCKARTILLGLAAFVAALAVVQAMTGLVTAYLGDIRAMSAVNQGRVVYALFFSGFRNWLPLAATAGIVVAAAWAVARKASPHGFRPMAATHMLLVRETFAVDALLLVAAALFAESQNTGGLGLIAAAAVLFHAEAWRARSVATAFLLAALLFPVLDIAVKRPLTALTREREAAPVQVLEALAPGTRVPLSTYEGARLFSRIAAEWLPFAREVQDAGFFLDPDPTTNAPAARLAWAMSAVEAGEIFNQRGYRNLASRYATLSFADPFARMLKLVPARGTTIATEIGRTVPFFTPDEAARYLADADGVFVDRCDLNGGENNDAAFQSVLDAGFQRSPLNNCWDFYHRSRVN